MNTNANGTKRSLRCLTILSWGVALLSPLPFSGINLWPGVVTHNLIMKSTEDMEVLAREVDVLRLELASSNDSNADEKTVARLVEICFQLYFAKLDDKVIKEAIFDIKHNVRMLISSYAKHSSDASEQVANLLYSKLLLPQCFQDENVHSAWLAQLENVRYSFAAYSSVIKKIATILADESIDAAAARSWYYGMLELLMNETLPTDYKRLGLSIDEVIFPIVKFICATPEPLAEAEHYLAFLADEMHGRYYKRGGSGKELSEQLYAEVSALELDGERCKPLENFKKVLRHVIDGTEGDMSIALSVIHYPTMLGEDLPDECYDRHEKPVMPPSPADRYIPEAPKLDLAALGSEEDDE